MASKLDQRLKQEARDFLRSRIAGNRRPAQPLTAATVLQLTGIDCPSDPDTLSPGQAKKLRARLILALKRERGRAKAGCPDYSFSRHIALHQAVKALS